MGHFYNLGSPRYKNVEVMFPRHGDRFDDKERQEILERIEDVIAIVNQDFDVVLVDRENYESWKGELDPGEPKTWEEYVRSLLENEWPFAVIFRR